MPPDQILHDLVAYVESRISVGQGIVKIMREGTNDIVTGQLQSYLDFLAWLESRGIKI